MKSKPKIMIISNLLQQILIKRRIYDLSIIYQFLSFQTFFFWEPFKNGKLIKDGAVINSIKNVSKSVQGIIFVCFATLFMFKSPLLIDNFWINNFGNLVKNTIYFIVQSLFLRNGFIKIVSTDFEIIEVLSFGLIAATYKF